MGINTMGRVRSGTVKKAARKIIEIYYQTLTDDFNTNKRIIDTVAEVRSKSLRNKIAGFATYLMRRMAHGYIRGVSHKTLDRIRESLTTYPLQQSCIKTDDIEVEQVTIEMLNSVNFEI